MNWETHHVAGSEDGPWDYYAARGIREYLMREQAPHGQIVLFMHRGRALQPLGLAGRAPFYGTGGHPDLVCSSG